MRPATTALDRAYDECRRILARHSSSYSLATRLLPVEQRRHVAALYAFARTADDLVDRPDTDPAAALAAFRRAFVDALASDRQSHLGPPVIMAVIDTIDRYGLSTHLFDRFFEPMEMDLTVTSYDTWGDLLDYMEGSAAVIGEMMLPILEPDPSRRATLVGPARDLGLAFQLTNFLRDVGEDLDRGRQYLPREDLERFGVDLTARTVGPGFEALMDFEIARCRVLYAAAAVGVAALPPGSARAIRAAHHLYSGILDEIERMGYGVFDRRARVSTARKLSLVARAWWTD